MAAVSGARGTGAALPAVAAVGEPTPTPFGTATAPAWLLVAGLLLDPYPGQIVFPAELPPGVRVVATEVEVVNRSDQPLAVAPYAISVRDTAGYGYLGGGLTGTEPALQARTLGKGERARGWVWFAVPVDARLTELVFAPSVPELAIDLPSTATPAAAEIADDNEVVVTEDAVNLRAAPSLDARVLSVLSAGTVLRVTGPAVEGSGLRWSPVTDPGTETKGYVAADLLATPESG